MQGDLHKFSDVLQQLKQKHANDPQLQQLDGLILPSSKKELIYEYAFSNLHCICCSSALFLTGCQHLTQTTTTKEHSRMKINLTYKVKLGYVHHNNLAVHFLHGHNNRKFDIELTGILGLVKHKFRKPW
jgi:hypothetical protein